MSVDREQVRRDKQQIAADLRESLHALADTVDRVLATYDAELEQAERERDDYKAALETSDHNANVTEHELRLVMLERNAALARALVAEAQLAKVPALVEALREIESFPISGYHAGAAQRMAREALAAVEQEQKP